MSTIIISLGIALAVLFSIRATIKGKGSCGDCDCGCPVKDSHHEPS